MLRRCLRLQCPSLSTWSVWVPKRIYFDDLLPLTLISASLPSKSAPRPPAHFPGLLYTVSAPTRKVTLFSGLSDPNSISGQTRESPSRIAPPNPSSPVADTRARSQPLPVRRRPPGCPQRVRSLHPQRSSGLQPPFSPRPREPRICRGSSTKGIGSVRCWLSQSALAA